MKCGLFGKLPAKRDFIAILAPRAFLDVWEPWMQGGLSASRQALTERWAEVFCTAPIWRFWLGAGICQRTVLGAFMPSMDGLGRYYPLTIFGYADPGAAIPPPELGSQDAWFDAAEALLLSTLEKDVSFDTLTGRLDGFEPPQQQLMAELPPPFVRTREEAIATLVNDGNFDVFSGLRTAGHESTYAAASFWWTLGGKDYRPLALTCKGMPDPFLFTTILSGLASGPD